MLPRTMAADVCITEYTDPGCPWAYSAEPFRRRLTWLYGDRLEWRVSQGRGTVYATTVVYPAEGAPFNVALVDCDEGFRLMSRVEDIAPEHVRIGQRVRFRVHRVEGDDPSYPVFIPAENA